VAVNAEQYFFEGIRLLADNDLTGAQVCFRQALQHDPEFSEAHANLGFTLEHSGAWTEAEACYRCAIALNPDVLSTHLNLGGLLTSQKRLAEAEETYEHALSLDDASPALWSNLGALYLCWQKETQAERCLRLAIALDASYAKPRFNLAYVLLRQGRFDEGWACLEARDWYAALARNLTCPRWAGEPLVGKSVLIGYEAGHGDMVQFCRYASVLKAQGAAHITLMCHPALKRLFSSLAAVDEVVAFDAALPLPALGNWDYWTPPLSIPYHCQTRIDSIPASLPYLHAQPDAVAYWETLLPRDGLRVGLVWKGNPQFENDADRSLPHLAVLAPLGRLAGASFISLQKGAGEAQAQHPPAGLPLLDLGPQMADFADAAAIVAGLDLVICVDTAIAHLAGALGKPCWVLLPDYKTDWRWMTHRIDSPWYPGVMRLFRQHTAGDWAPVVAEVCAALAERIS
jgi:tetratricopeptide (TPR) repeat protein